MRGRDERDVEGPGKLPRQFCGQRRHAAVARDVSERFAAASVTAAPLRFADQNISFHHCHDFGVYAAVNRFMASSHNACCGGNQWWIDACLEVVLQSACADSRIRDDAGLQDTD